jgi:hypothetical protein
LHTYLPSLFRLPLCPHYLRASCALPAVSLVLALCAPLGVSGVSTARGRHRAPQPSFGAASASLPASAAARTPRRARHARCWLRRTRAPATPHSRMRALATPIRCSRRP